MYESMRMLDEFLFGVLHPDMCPQNFLSESIYMFSEFSVYAFLIFIGVYFGVLFLQKKLSFIQCVLYIGICYSCMLAVYIINDDILKSVFHRIRPYQALDSCLIGTVSSEFSFPSGHSVCISILGLLFYKLCAHKGKIVATTLSLLVIFCLFCRVYLGAHYPFDVIIGGIFGCVSGILLFSLISRIPFIKQFLPHE